MSVSAAFLLGRVAAATTASAFSRCQEDKAKANSFRVNSGQWVDHRVNDKLVDAHRESFEARMGGHAPAPDGIAALKSGVPVSAWTAGKKKLKR